MNRGHEAPMDVDENFRRTPFVALWEDQERHEMSTQKKRPAVTSKELLAPPQTKVSKHKKKLHRPQKIP